jgi:uncharacterized LabA/DUF88 family protein
VSRDQPVGPGGPSAQGDPRILLLIDFDNLPDVGVTLTSTVGDWLRGLEPLLPPHAILDATLRSYGGWWDGNAVSPARETAAGILLGMPALVRTESRYWRVHYQMADALLSTTAESIDIRETYVRRRVPSLTIAPGALAACDNLACEVGKCRSWFFRKRACTQKRCKLQFGDVWERSEQKQVDVHLATDLLLASIGAGEETHLAVASDDSDFLPALAAVTKIAPNIGSLSHLRLARQRSYLDHFLVAAGVTIVRSQGGSLINGRD